jgi:AraC-like DNA-binding protein
MRNLPCTPARLRAWLSAMRRMFRDLTSMTPAQYRQAYG